MLARGLRSGARRAVASVNGGCRHSCSFEQQQPNKKCRLRYAIGQLLNPVCSWICAVENECKYGHQNHSQKPYGKEDNRWKGCHGLTDTREAHFISICKERGQHEKEACGHENAHLDK